MQFSYFLFFFIATIFYHKNNCSNVILTGPPRNNQERLLYYYSMSSYNQRWVPTRILRNETLATSSPNEFQAAVNERSSQGGDCAMDNNGVLFFGLLGDQAVACWNTQLPYFSTVLFQNDETMQFPVSVQVYFIFLFGPKESTLKFVTNQ